LSHPHTPVFTIMWEEIARLRLPEAIFPANRSNCNKVV
jgi:hypothetical protein